MITKSHRMAMAGAAFALGMAGSAFADDGRHGHGQSRDGRFVQQQPYHQTQRHAAPRDDHRRFDARAWAPEHRPDVHPHARPDRRFDARAPHPQAQWQRGGRLPGAYRAPRYVVDDWRGHRLQAPPRGYQWVGVGGDFVLAAVATGLIAQIIAAQ
jgi:Ni/Co efflux regulator RcnB